MNARARVQHVAGANDVHNDPCWCGSGRRYKKCHMRHEQLPLDAPIQPT